MGAGVDWLDQSPMQSSSVIMFGPNPARAALFEADFITLIGGVGIRLYTRG
jgi:hypothetical protein